jgi:hypothetical protein
MLDGKNDGVYTFIGEAASFVTDPYYLTGYFFGRGMLASPLSSAMLNGALIGGDNLFEHSAIINKTKKQISNANLTFYPKSKRLAMWNIVSNNFKKYESVQFTIDPNNFKIYGISGMIYNLDKNECVSIQKNIIRYMLVVFRYILRAQNGITPARHNASKA